MKTHEIKLKIKKESDLYEPLSPDKELSSIVMSYLEHKIGERKVEKEFCSTSYLRSR